MTDSTQTTRTGLDKALTWLATLILGLMVVMAGLAGNGLWAAKRTLITGHQHTGNLLFVLTVVLVVLSFVLYQRKRISTGLMISNGLVLFLTFCQAGIGYVGKTNLDVRAWHFTVGTLLTIAITASVVLAWQHTSRRTA